MTDQARYVSIDLETGGLDPTLHPITEVGLVIESHGHMSKTEAENYSEYGRMRVEEVTFSLPFDTRACDPKALDIQKYYERRGLEDYPPRWEPSRAAGFLHEVLDGAYLVGKNPSFDAGFVQALLRLFGLTPTWHHRLVDVGALYWGYHNGLYRHYLGGVEELPREIITLDDPPNSAKVAELSDIALPEDTRHAALVDASWAYRVFRKVVPRG